MEMCAQCRFYLASQAVCGRYPKHENHGYNDWCGEFASTEPSAVQLELERLRAENEALRKAKKK